MSKPIFTIPSIKLDGTRDTFEGQPATAAGYSVEITSEGLFVGLKNHAVNQAGELMMTAAEAIPLFAPSNHPLKGVLFRMFLDKVMTEYGALIANIAAGPYPEEYFLAWGLLKTKAEELAATPEAIFPAALDLQEQIAVDGNEYGPIFRSVCPLVLAKALIENLTKPTSLDLLNARKAASDSALTTAEQELATAQQELADAEAHNANPPEATPADPGDPDAEPPVPPTEATYEEPIDLKPLQDAVKVKTKAKTDAETVAFERDAVLAAVNAAA